MTTVKQVRHDRSLTEFFGRHLVGLSVTYRLKGDIEAGQPDRFAMYSGTLIEIKGVVSLLTAGHCLEEIEKYLADDRIEITSAALADTFGAQRVDDHPIPFDLKNAAMFHIDDEQQGLDFGVIMLAPYYVRLLAKNGVIALGEQNWIHQPKIEFQFYRMLGFPAEFTSERVSAAGGFVLPVLLPVERLDSLPSGKPETDYPRFVGRIGDVGVKSVVGMSGGPILGFRLEEDGTLRYWVVALQSRWDEHTRTVYGCSLPILASLMTKWATQVPDGVLQTNKER